MSEPPVKDEGGDPDPRVLLANERTMLAWTRTALALMAVGAAVTQLPSERDVPGAELVGLPLIVIGAAVGLMSQRTWRRRHDAIQAGSPLPPFGQPWLLVVALIAAAVIAAAVVLAG